MPSKNAGKISPSIVLILVIALLVGGVAFWATREKPQPVTEEAQSQPVKTQQIQMPPLPETPADVASEYELQGELPALNQSDDAVRAHLQLLGGAQPLQWLQGEQLIRRIVVEVANVADGDVVYQQMPLKRRGEMGVQGKGGGHYLMDPDSYHRYDAYVNFFTSIDPDLLVAFYRYYEPLLDQAYAELGNPIGAFRSELLKAIGVMLKAPVIDGEVELIQPEVNYEFRDPSLESLPSVDKQLIRMGPDNTRKIQEALRQFRRRID